MDGDGCLISVLASISILSYNQTLQFIAYMICLIYGAIRYYHYIPDGTRYVRVLGYSTVSLMFIYFFARAFSQRDRENFVYSRKQRQLLEMFKNLIKVNHDGIIFTKNDKIVFFNHQMNSILNIPNISITDAA